MPGCRPTITAFLLSLLVLIAAFFIIILSADFDARYEYQSPNLLSKILPTRAESHANTDLVLLFNLGIKCFIIRAGKIVLASNRR